MTLPGTPRRGPSEHPTAGPYVLACLHRSSSALGKQSQAQKPALQAGPESLQERHNVCTHKMRAAIHRTV